MSQPLNSIRYALAYDYNNNDDKQKGLNILNHNAKLNGLKHFTIHDNNDTNVSYLLMTGWKLS